MIKMGKNKVVFESYPFLPQMGQNGPKYGGGGHYGAPHVKDSNKKPTFGRVNTYISLYQYAHVFDSARSSYANFSEIIHTNHPEIYH